MKGPLTVPRLAGGGALALLLLTWLASGSFLTALLVVVLVVAVAGGAWLLVSWGGRPPRATEGSSPVADALPTADLSPPSGGERVRRALRGLLGRPWVQGDGIVRAAARRLASEDALVWTPRGQRVTAPHLWVELHPDDLADVAARWPLEVLADELLSGYLEHARSTEARRMAERTFLHLLAGTDVPVGRVVVTAAFSRPAASPAATASATEPTPSSVASPAAPATPAGDAAPPAPPGSGPAVPGAAGRPGRALLPPPPRPVPARGPAGDSRDSVGGSRGRGAARGPATTVVLRRPGGVATADTARLGGRPGARVTPRAGATIVERVVATARGAGRPGVPWRRPADPRRGGER
ncbi:hypothetical protein [Actinomycetospora straminea]|uniref:Uncharacterized protein n=1 Tax=Actinomycetospora straminea TaxID=663607 RepID=A0ABP9DXJ7_9PSEU|nr:hypothetical protein [Actinomycetospora straminea]MDD7934226.1 hypothetical protein [Actinomycetospora straminea]